MEPSQTGSDQVHGNTPLLRQLPSTISVVSRSMAEIVFFDRIFCRFFKTQKTDVLKFTVNLQNNDRNRPTLSAFSPKTRLVSASVRLYFVTRNRPTLSANKKAENRSRPFPLSVHNAQAQS